MRSRLISSILLLCLLTWAAIFVTAQSTPITGIPPLSSTAGGPFDVVNLANLNAHFAIPVFSRPGKGVSFSYSLVYDSLVWQVITNSGGQLQWAPMSNWGWSGSTQPTTGFVTYTYSDTTVVCGSNNVEKETWNNFVYYDSFGVPHRFGSGTGSSVWVYDDPGCGSSKTSMTLAAPENSGYQIQVGPVYTGEQNVPTTVTAAGGVKISPPSLSSSGSGTVQDTNGNLISVSASGNTTFTDTLNTTALTISGSAPNPMVLTYTAPAGNTSVTVNYSAYTVQTNFNISVNSTRILEYGPTQVYLVSSITLPDHSSYSFSYENTGGYSGKVTGRLASVTLPTGGQVAYSYANGGCSNSSNCMMSDGSPAFMSRSLGGGVWTYTRTLQSGQQLPQTMTTLIDAAANETDLNFSGIYETERYAYNSNGSSKTLARETHSCYNGNWTNCPSAVVSAPITYQAFFNTENGAGPYTTYEYWFNSQGLLYQELDHDYTGRPNIRTIYTNYNSTLCTSYNICDRPSSVQVSDGNGNSKAYTSYAYDEGRNTLGSVTSINRSTSGLTGGPFLTQHYTYNPGGTLATATDVNGTGTTYSYTGNSCNGAFPTSVSAGGLTTQYAYNCTGGVVTSTTDPNNASTSTSYTDAYFWRPASGTDALGNVTTYSYISPTQVESVMNFNGGNSTNDELITLDGLGRTILDQKRQAPSPGSANCDTVQTIYDYEGRVSWLTLPYSSTCWQSGGSVPATNYNYDALNRYTLVQDWTGIRAQYQYNANDVTVTVPAPSGENPKKKQIEHDALGRVISVCEILNSGGSSCGQNTSASGYLTAYGYDANSNLLSVSQGAQTRTFTYDGLSRMLSETHPETTATGSGGTTNYTYDSDATCGSSTGDKVKRIDPATNVSCYGYDGLHRLTQVTYPSGPNASVTAEKHFYWDWASWNGLTLNNPKGRLSGALTVLNGGWPTETAFSFDARGQVTDYYQASTNSGGWYHVQQSYNAIGQRVVLQGFKNDGSILSHYFWYDTNEGEGRHRGVGDGTSGTGYPYPWSGTTYTAAGLPTTLSMPGASESFTYDTPTNRLTQWASKKSDLSKSQTGTLFWNVNGTLQELQITDSYNTADNNLTCTHSYDDLARLASVDCGQGNWGQGFSYDAFGNITKSVLSGRTGVSFSPGYNTANNHATGFVYDAMGDIINDGSRIYTYDAEGRPVTVAGIQIIYDAFGRMVERGSPGQVLYDASGNKFAYMNGQSVQNYFVPLTAGVQAVYGSSGLQYYRHSDWLGSSRLQLDPSGTMTGGRAYAPFGETFADTGTDRSFTGQTQDVIPGSTGIYDFLFRQQSSSQGRWLVPDPAGLAAVDITNPQTWNRYAYVGNNPLSNVDPLGLCDYFICITVTAPYPPPGSLGGGSGGGNPLRLQLQRDDKGSGGGGGGRNWRCILFGQGCPEPPPPPAPKPPPAPPVTLTCQGSASFSDVSQSQLNYLLSKGGGALRPNIVPSTGTVAIGGTKTFGLSYGQLRQFGTYISINPTDLSGTISDLGGPAPPYSVSDIGDPNIRNASGTRFDIYAFPNGTANTFAIQNSNATTYTIPAVTGAHCPSGSQLIQGPPQ